MRTLIYIPNNHIDAHYLGSSVNCCFPLDYAVGLCSSAALRTLLNYYHACYLVVIDTCYILKLVVTLLLKSKVVKKRSLVSFSPKHMPKLHDHAIKV